MDTLYVTMLGGFHVAWQGREFILSQNSAPRFLELLQLVWLRGEEGIGREELLSCLYEERNLRSAPNSFSNLLYQLRGRLREAGLPDAQYVVRREKRYYPDPSVPLETDVAAFTGYIADARRLARENTDRAGLDRAAAVYRKALSSYGGVLLPSLRGRRWVEDERDYLDSLYREAETCMAAADRAAAGDSPGPVIFAAAGSADHCSVSREEMERISDGKAGVLVCGPEMLPALCRELAALQESYLPPSHLMILTLTDYAGRTFDDAGFPDVNRTADAGTEKASGKDGEKLRLRYAVMEDVLRAELRGGDVLTQISAARVAVIVVGRDASDRRRLIRAVRGALRRRFGTSVRVQWSERDLREIDLRDLDLLEKDGYFTHSSMTRECFLSGSSLS